MAGISTETSARTVCYFLHLFADTDLKPDGGIVRINAFLGVWIRLNTIQHHTNFIYRIGSFMFPTQRLCITL